MLTELTIQNYRLFKHLHLQNLKRVNLIAGKNNTGKTALLEALRILESRGENTVVNHILKQRGEFTPSRAASYEGLFTRGSLNGNATSIRLNELTIKRTLGKHEEVIYHVEEADGRQANLGANITPDYPNDRAVYVPFSGNTRQLEELWENIVLTELEDELIKILRATVEPRLLRLDVKESQAKVRLKGEPQPVSLQSLGDGVQRILALSLALVNAKNKLLLIDEFEAGLHHSVQEKLWEITFEYATKWNIQIFATTHSEDTLRAFYYVASQEALRDQAAFVRLQYNRMGTLEAVKYDLCRLESALEMNLEIR
jgi:predicted ATP-dependent endonuclease of OLD family